MECRELNDAIAVSVLADITLDRAKTGYGMCVSTVADGGYTQMTSTISSVMPKEDIVQLYYCLGCDIRGMRSSYAGAHSERTRHRVVVETPECTLERTKLTRSELVAKGEAKFAQYIIDPRCDSNCRCPACWTKFQRDWLTNNSDE